MVITFMNVMLFLRVTDAMLQNLGPEKDLEESLRVDDFSNRVFRCGDVSAMEQLVTILDVTMKEQVSSSEYLTPAF